MLSSNSKWGGFLKYIIIGVGATFVCLSIYAKFKKSESVYEDQPEQKNPFEGKTVVFIEDETEQENVDGVRGHLEAVGKSYRASGIYEKYIKRSIDILLSFGGMVILSPVLASIALAIKIDDPGPVLFIQKRLGRDKQFFKMHKFRSMKMSTPQDVPTHMLENPEQYITKVGGFLRKHSLDELPQIWDIFIGNLSIIGPRPGLWNQDILTAERDKYGVNEIKPGLTGWAQINGRDELEIPQKAKLDGEYVKNLGLMMDIKCFLGSLHVFGADDSVVEGGTGKKMGRHYTDGKSSEDLIGYIGFGEVVEIDTDAQKKVLIVGTGSYIGESFKAYAIEHYEDNFIIDTVDTLGDIWRKKNFGSYDIIYHVAGIAHADVGNVNEATKEKYYVVNTDLAIEVAEKAKAEGALEFIFMSSMIIYGDSARYGQQKVIDEYTVPTPANFYGDSKLQADVGVRELADDNFKVVVLRPPMIYGRGSRGNYPILAKLAKRLPVFPDNYNERSMLHIDNLCEFLCQVMMVKGFERDSVVLIPQNAEWTNTGQMVKEIAEVSGGKIRELGILKPAVYVGSKLPGRIGELVNKAFGSSCYDYSLSIYPGLEYQKVSFRDSIKRTEGAETKYTNRLPDQLDKYSVLMSVYIKEKPEYFIQALDSMINQTVKPDEIVLVEDGPLNDELYSIIEDYRKRYPGLMNVVVLEKNGGLGNALNQGIKVCRNELIARMDTDDISKPERCQMQLKAFQDDPQLDIIGTQIDECIDTPDNITLSRVVPLFHEDILIFSRRRSPFNHPTVMYRKSTVEKMGGYNAYGRKEDLDLFIRMINEGCKAANLQDSYLFYRTNSDNLQRRKNWTNCKEYIQIMYGFYRKGYSGFVDILYVVVGQMLMYLTPRSVTKKLSDKYLRKGK